MKKIILITILSITAFSIEAQVPNYVPTNGLVGWWPFNGNANDESGNGNNGTVNGATLTTDRFGNTNKAYNFSGTTNNITIQNSNSILTGSFSVSSWFTINNLNPSNFDAAIIGQFNGQIQNDRKWFFGYRSINQEKGISYYLFNNNGLSVSNNYTLNWQPQQGRWYHVSWVFESGNSIKTYVDGILHSNVQVNIATFNNIANNILIKIGNAVDIDVPLPLPWNGKIDDIGLWSRAISQSEITALYTGCNNVTNITPQNNSVNIGNTAIFTANTAATSPNYIWQSDFGQGFVTLNNYGKYSGTTAKNMSISNVQLSNHLQPIRAIVTSLTCTDTSNIAYIKITDTCITKITKYDTIKVMDTLVINAILSGISAPNNTNRIIVYPNPSKDHITIDYGVFSRMSGYTMKITNTLGQTVFSSPINQQSSFINLSSWTGKGVYYMQIIDPQSNMIENRKIILQ